MSHISLGPRLPIYSYASITSPPSANPITSSEIKTSLEARNVSTLCSNYSSLITLITFNSTSTLHPSLRPFPFSLHLSESNSPRIPSFPRHPHGPNFLSRQSRAYQNRLEDFTMHKSATQSHLSTYLFPFS